MTTLRAAALVSLAALSTGAGCYRMRPSSGGGQASFAGPRPVRAADVAVPAGYAIEAVATGLTFPTGVAFDEQGRVHVVEAGYSYGEKWTTPRLLRIPAAGEPVVVASGTRNGPWTGVVFHDGAFFVAEGGQMEGGRILRIAADGAAEPIVSGLPSLGDHHTNGPAAGPDGWIYFGQGTATNSGVVGEDNFQFGWLSRHPDFHDTPCQDVTLAGANFESANPLTADADDRARTGAFLP
ncbi:MAG TPA: glucose dehydrogenase, partial [Vicinamibacteria bacterium]|nr:glucose dehydrogenase [Vicinamibacteria bacterium]